MISVIIPTLNEEQALPQTLEALGSQGEEHEIIVADAQSSDNTVNLAETSGCRVIDCKTKGRSAQMNQGASVADGDILLFLHADTHLPEGALASLVRAMEDEKILGGGYARRFHSRSPLLRFNAFCGSMRSRIFGLHFGDQAMFVRRDAFEELGGFPDLPALEDIEFSRRLKKLGKVRTLKPTLVSSARRFEQRGVLAVSASDIWLTLRFMFGADAGRLASEYARRNS